VAALRELAKQGEVPPDLPVQALKKYALDDVTAAAPGETGGDS
jgi:pyruvate dehydrogenase E1 component